MIQKILLLLIPTVFAIAATPVPGATPRGDTQIRHELLYLSGYLGASLAAPSTATGEIRIAVLTTGTGLSSSEYRALRYGIQSVNATYIPELREIPTTSGTTADIETVIADIGMEQNYGILLLCCAPPREVIRNVKQHSDLPVVVIGAPAAPLQARPRVTAAITEDNGTFPVRITRTTNQNLQEFYALRERITNGTLMLSLF